MAGGDCFLLLTLVHFAGMGVATVQLDVVHFPVGEGVGVHLQVAENARVTRASVVSEVLVDAEFKPLGVHLQTPTRRQFPV